VRRGLAACQSSAIRRVQELVAGVPRLARERPGAPERGLPSGPRPRGNGEPRGCGEGSRTRRPPGALLTRAPEGGDLEAMARVLGITVRALYGRFGRLGLRPGDL